MVHSFFLLVSIFLLLLILVLILLFKQVRLKSVFILYISKPAKPVWIL